MMKMSSCHSTSGGDDAGGDGDRDVRDVWPRQTIQRQPGTAAE